MARKTIKKAATKKRAKVARAPYKCETTIENNVCLKFYWNPTEQRYNLPPGGERVACSDCKYFFYGSEPR